MQQDDLVDVQFRIRPDRRTRRVAQSPRSWWFWIGLVGGSVVFVLLIRVLLERTAATAGPPEQASASLGASALPAPPIDGAPSDASMGNEIGADAPKVFRCEAEGRAVSFQSAPCTADQRMTREIRVFQDFRQPNRRPPPQPPSSTEPARYGSRTTARDPQVAVERARCASARAYREQSLERMGLRRTYDVLQQLDDLVREACKGG